MGIDGDLADLSMIAGGDTDSIPTEATLAQFAKVKAQVDAYAARWSQIVSDDLPKIKLLVIKHENE